jgi:hypothetical protein
MVDVPPTPIHLKVAEAFVRAREAMRPSDRAHADARLTDWLEAFETDMADVARPILQQYADHPDTPADAAAALNTAINPEHQTQFGLLFAVLGGLFYPMVSATMTGPAQALTQLSLRKDPNTPLSPAQLALGVVKNTVAIGDAYTEALNSGVVGPKFDTLVLNTGEPPGPQTLLSWLNRGIIDVPTFEHGIRQGLQRDEWIPFYERARLSPPPAAEIVNGVIKQRLDPNAGAALFEQTGGDTANWPWIIAAAGRPYGIEQALHLWNRGSVDPTEGIDETEVRTVIAHSDVNPEFTDDILKLRWYIPPVRSIMPMLRSGAIDDARATTLFREQGVRDADIPGYLAEAHHGRTSAVKELSVSTVVRLYVNGLLDHAGASARLGALGYQPADTDLLLGLADDTRRERYAQAVVTRMHALYVAHKATDADVQNALAADGIGAGTIAELLTLWRIEQQANVHAPTVPAVMHAYRVGIITPADAHLRLVELGVRAGDMPVVIAGGYPPTANHAELVANVQAIVTSAATAPAGGGGGAAGKHLSQTQITDLLGAHAITRTEALTRLEGLGYSAADADAILVLAGFPAP